MSKLCIPISRAPKEVKIYFIWPLSRYLLAASRLSLGTPMKSDGNVAGLYQRGYFLPRQGPRSPL
jgi:hypothetical protein